MSYNEIIENSLQPFNLPKMKFEDSFRNEVLIPCIELLEEYTNNHDELDYDNIIIVMMLILNRMYERSIRRRTPRTIVFTSAIIWHSVINKNIVGKYIMQFPLKNILNGNLRALRSLREDLNIKERKYDDINDFIDKLKTKPPLWQIIKEAVLKLNGSPSIRDIQELIGNLYDDISTDDIEIAIYCCTVNSKKRFVCNYNLELRVSNREFDILYHLGEETFELYNPDKNGVWEIIEDSSGSYACNQKISPEVYKDLKEFIYNKKENIFVCATAMFLYFNTQKKYYSDNEIWREYQIYSEEVLGETPEASLTTEIIRHSEGASVATKRKDLFFEVREGKPNKFKLLDTIRNEFYNFLSSKGISGSFSVNEESELQEIDYKPKEAQQRDPLITDIDKEDGVDVSIDIIYENTYVLERIKDALQIKKQIILMGPPGTSKSYLAEQIALMMTENKRENIKFVQFHPSYSYEDFVECNTVESGEKGGEFLKFVSTKKVFRTFCDKAEKSDEKFVFIIDEINRGNVERIFGELIYCLENRKKKVQSVYFQDESFSIPENISIIGTMNTVDLSIANIDTALRRRFYIIELNPNSEILKNWLEYNLEDKYLEFRRALVKFMENLNSKIKKHHLMGKYRTIGHAYYMLKAIRDNANLPNIWKNLEMEWEFAIKPTLLEYLNFSENDLKPFNEEFESLSIEVEELIYKEIETLPEEKRIEVLAGYNQLTGTPLKRYKFWTKFLEKANEHRLDQFADKKPTGDSWISVKWDIKDLYLTSNILLDRSRIQVDIDSEDHEWNKKFFRNLEKYKAIIHESFGSPLIWSFIEDRKAQRICKVTTDLGLNNDEEWDEIQEEMIDKLIKLESALRPYMITEEKSE